MQGYRIPEFVLDIGTRENYESAQKLWPNSEGEVWVNS
jgi:NDP-sugar pyrophosphorylase family protein